MKQILCTNPDGSKEWVEIQKGVVAIYTDEEAAEALDYLPRIYPGCKFEVREVQ